MPQFDQELKNEELEGLMQRFGEKLRTLRIKHRMTVRELAQALGYTAYSHVGEVETGRQKPSIDFALRVSRLFNVTMDQLTKNELKVDGDCFSEE